LSGWWWGPFTADAAGADSGDRRQLTPYATFAEGHSDANNALKGRTKIVNSANFKNY
jgi:hypothetical protein